MKRSDVPSDRSAGLRSTGAFQRPSVTSTSLLERLKAADVEGWNRLVKLYGPLVYSWARRQGLQSHDAADVSQEVFDAVSRSIQTFRRQRAGDSFRKWLKTIAMNKIRDQGRRRSREPQAFGGDDAQRLFAEAPQPEETETFAGGGSQGEQNEDAQEVNHLLRQALELVRADFEPNTWQAFWQTSVEGRQTADVAADLGLTANAVRIARSRIRARLREEFGELLE